MWQERVTQRHAEQYLEDLWVAVLFVHLPQRIGQVDGREELLISTEKGLDRLQIWNDEKEEMSKIIKMNSWKEKGKRKRKYTRAIRGDESEDPLDRCACSAENDQKLKIKMNSITICDGEWRLSFVMEYLVRPEWSAVDTLSSEWGNRGIPPQRTPRHTSQHIDLCDIKC
jgi:hypothetical protein